MSLKVKSNWRIAVNAAGLAVSLWLVGFYLWAGLARHRWHWGFILLWAFWGFCLYPVKPVSIAPARREENVADLFPDACRAVSGLRVHDHL